MTAYPTDFPGAGYGLEPVQPELVMGIDPLLTLLLGVLIVAAVAGSFLLGQHLGKSRAGKDAIDAIYDAIKEDLKAAMGAGNSELIARSDIFMATLRRHLGDLMGFSAELNKMVGSLKGAMSGVIKVDPPTAEEKCKGSGKSCGCGDHKCSGHGGCSSGAAAAAAASAGGPVIVNVLGGSAHTETPPHREPTAPPCPPPKPDSKPAGGDKVDKKLTAEEQRDLISKHLRDLYSWWSAEHDRKREMRAIRDGLTTPPLRKPNEQGSNGPFGPAGQAKSSHK